MRHRPHRAQTTEVVEWDRGRRHRRLDDLAGEEPLEIRLNGTPVTVTMRTPGDDFELAVGLLVTEGVVQDRREIQTISFGRGTDDVASGNIVEVTGAPRSSSALIGTKRHFASSSSCGVCGKASIDAVRARHLEPPSRDMRVDAAALCRMPDALRAVQTVFGRTGGLHGAALFESGGTLVAAREDIGRHNAVDKIVGRAWLDGLVPLSRHVLLVSGRGGFEIVQKALVAGVPVVASVSAPSSLAVRLAREYGMTLIGFLRDSRFVVYSAEERLSGEPAGRRRRSRSRARLSGASSLSPR